MSEISEDLDNLLIKICANLDTIRNTIDKEPEKAKRFLEEMVVDITQGIIEKNKEIEEKKVKKWNGK